MTSFDLVVNGWRTYLQLYHWGSFFLGKSITPVGPPAIASGFLLTLKVLAYDLVIYARTFNSKSSKSTGSTTNIYDASTVLLLEIVILEEFSAYVQNVAIYAI